MKLPYHSTQMRQNHFAFSRAFSIARVVLTVVIVVALAGIVIPMFSVTTVHCGASKELAQAKQIGLGLKLYAGDHDGVYPAGTNLQGETIRSSNDAFRSLFPDYTQSENLFWSKRPDWQVPAPDDVITPAAEILKPGENVYAYMEGLTDALNPSLPLVVDGTDGTGHYTTKKGAKGNVWNGAKAIVIRLDNSGALENLIGPDNARYVRYDGENKLNLLDVASYQKAQTVHLIDEGTNVQLRLLEPAFPTEAQRK